MLDSIFGWSLLKTTGCVMRMQIMGGTTGWGPNRLFLPGKYVVGTKRDSLIYYWPQPKKPEQPYGIQGVNHLLPDKGIIAKPMPCKVKLKKDLMYTWCACGYSNNQPFCDGTHNRLRTVRLHPVRYIPEKDEDVWLCQCKQTKNRPFCDGTHKTLPPPEFPSTSAFKGHVKKSKFS